jgi:molecular chaperone DnaJ
MAKRDYYTVLGVNRDATEDDLKKAYRKLAMKYHPDRNPDDKAAEERFKEAKEAYEVLTEPRKRAAYDQFGHAGVDAASGAGGRGPGPEGFGGFADAFGDIFSEIFGQGQRGRGNGVFRGADLRYNLELSLEEAARGTEAKIKIPTLETCATCRGSGAKPGTQPKACPTCGGRGEVKTARTVCYEILRELLREARQFNAREYRILAAPSVIDLYLDEESQSLAMLSDFIGKAISLQAEASYNQEQYDIVLM